MSGTRLFRDYTVEELMSGENGRPVLYVAEPDRDRIRTQYGRLKFVDFDTLLDFNTKIAGKHDNCFSSMLYWMNECDGHLRDQWQKLYGFPVLSDVFNILQSAVRLSAGVDERVWYE